LESAPFSRSAEQDHRDSSGPHLVTTVHSRHTLISGPLTPCHLLPGTSLQIIIHRRRVLVTRANRIVQTRSTTNKDNRPSHLTFVASAPTTNMNDQTPIPHSPPNHLRSAARLVGLFIVPCVLSEKFHEILVPRCACRSCLCAHIVFVLLKLPFPRAGGCITGCVCEFVSFLLSFSVLFTSGSCVFLPTLPRSLMIRFSGDGPAAIPCTCGPLPPAVPIYAESCLDSAAGCSVNSGIMACSFRLTLGE